MNKLLGPVRFFVVLKVSPPLHFYLLQLIGLLYLAWRFASRNYTVYGLLPEDALNYPRPQMMELWPWQSLHVTSFKFIYAWLPHPSPEVIFALQVLVVSACVVCSSALLLLCFEWNRRVKGTTPNDHL